MKVIFYSFLQTDLQLPQQILINISLNIKMAINLDDVYVESTFLQLVLKRQLQFKNVLNSNSNKTFLCAPRLNKIYFMLISLSGLISPETF